ncbi:lipopolysaccharide biosynthesis protein [Actinoplanes sp. NPDC049681]|uniref:lipopolysaccharide biosynthesis protein n=1 Tax=Actinoplanes sp. NPDC049681 TaxID=3363905 RepID=UPI0037AE3FEB
MVSAPATRWQRNPPRRVARSSGLRKNLAWSLAGNATYAGMQWATVVVIARTGNTEMVGRFSLALAVTAPITLLAAMSLRTVFVTDPSRQCSFGDYLRVRLTSMLLAFIAIAAVSLHFDHQTRDVILVVGIAKTIDGIGDMLVGVFQKMNDMRRIAMSSILNGTLTTGLVAVSLLTTSSITIACWGSVLASTLSSIVYCSVALRRTASRSEAADIREFPIPVDPRSRLVRSRALVLTALPLGLAASISSATWNVPRYVLGAETSITTLGIFSAISYIPTVINIAAAALAQNLLPKLTNMRNAGEGKRARQLVTRILVLAAAMSLVLSLLSYIFAATLLNAVYGHEYAQHAGLLTLLMATTTAGAAGFVLDAALSAQRRFRGQLAANAFACLVCSAFSFSLIPRAGIVGAGIAVAGMTFALLTIKLALFIISARQPLESESSRSG